MNKPLIKTAKITVCKITSSINGCAQYSHASNPTIYWVSWARHEISWVFATLMSWQASKIVWRPSDVGLINNCEHLGTFQMQLLHHQLLLSFWFRWRWLGILCYINRSQHMIQYCCLYALQYTHLHHDMWGISNHFETGLYSVKIKKIKSCCNGILKALMIFFWIFPSFQIFPFLHILVYLS